MLLPGLRPRVQWTLAAAAVALSGCSSSQDDLGVGGGTSSASSTATTSATTSTSATTTTTGTGGSDATTSSGSNGGGGSSGTGGSGGSAPSVPAEITVVNGVNDSNGIRICFLAYPGEENADDPPWPADNAGLLFARSRVIAPDAGVIPEGTDVRMYVIAGDVSVTAGKTCAEALAMGAPIVVTALPVLSIPVFQSGKSLLLVPNGCAGGPTHVDQLQTLACGSSYVFGSSNVGLVAGALSRDTDLDHVGLQVVHASAGMQQVDFRLTPGLDGALETQLAGNATAGTIAPTPPYFGFSAADLGTVGDATLRTYFPNNTSATSVTKVSAMLPNTPALSAADIDDGATFALVAVGAYPGLPMGPWWHALTYTLVRTDPQ